ncbi:hypothetical protein LVJ94_31785 [Pendulispora rubella]|uniref:1-deoxy-D-xylulose-5-phosphate synthase n=1 Tax=Pendulispora rubella TaxID=2741070 RepID=A0ABZ2KS56_9BACT
MRRIMYVENKGEGLEGRGRIGWVEFSRSGRTLYYEGHRLAKTGSGYKYNCIDEATGDAYWVSGPSKDGADRLYGGVVSVDDDARVEYWTTVRGLPARVADTEYRSNASTRTGGATRQTNARTRGRR